MAHKLPFEREIRNLSKQKYLLAIRLLDAITSEKKPCDFLAMNEKGGLVAIEAKARRGDVFKFSWVPAHQREALSMVANTKHGEAYLAVNLRTATGPGHSWMIPWETWLEFESGWHKKSARREELREYFNEYELIRITAGWRFSEQHRFRCDPQRR